MPKAYSVATYHSVEIDIVDSISTSPGQASPIFIFSIHVHNNTQQQRALPPLYEGGCEQG